MPFHRGLEAQRRVSDSVNSCCMRPPISDSLQVLVSNGGQELREVRAGHHLIEESRREREFAGVEPSGAEPFAQLTQLVLHRLPHELHSDATPIRKLRAVSQPLPHL